MTSESLAVFLFWVGIGVVSVFLSAIYSGLETGVYCLDRIRLHLRSRSPAPRSARVVEKLMNDPTRLLIVLLICNNIANYGTTAAAVVLLTGAGLGFAWAQVAVILLITPILFVWGEMVPKTLFRRHADSLVYRWSWLLGASGTLMTWIGLVGLVKALSSILLGLVRHETDSGGLLSSRQAIRGMLIETAHRGTLTGIQSEIAQNVLSLREVRLRDVMVPILAAEKIEERIDRKEFLATARRTTHTRLPVCRAGRPGQIIGVVNVLDGLLLNAGDFSLEKLITQPPKMPASWNVQTALTRLQRARQPMGIVTDTAGRCLGIVTMKDLVEEIVGELRAW